MAQNTSHAVMAQRIEPHDSLDFLPTPPWATRALCEKLERIEGRLWARTCWEPACGGGHMVLPLREYFGTVHASDVRDYGGDQERVVDFLLGWPAPPHIDCSGIDWIITNPPFRLAEDFAMRGFDVAGRGVALLVRSQFLEGVGRFSRLYVKRPPTYIYQFTERVPMHKGRLLRKGSTATAYCWLVWCRGREQAETKFFWIAPCRRRLERDDDYDTDRG